MGTVEEVRIARRAGFCYGVREAIDHARVSALEGRETVTLGQTVHNEGVIADLHARGVRTVDSVEAVPVGASVVIRAHGVTPDIRERAIERGLDVIDGTCSWVEQEHREVAKLVEEGYTIVLLGTPNHPEVTGILGYAPDAIVVDEEEEWDKVPRTKRMALVSQSTQPPWKFQKLAAFMVGRAHELRIVNSVCPVTIRRQEDTIALSREVDFMVVVGGRSSANTKELTRLVRLDDRPVLQIERARDLVDAAVFEGYRVVGITGGTSTPIEDLQTVATRVLELAGTPETRTQAAMLAAAAIAEVADPAYRSTSIGRADRHPVPASRRSSVPAARA